MISDEARVALVSDLVAAIEDIILEETGGNVLRSGWDGSFTPAGGQVAHLIESALISQYRSQS